MHVSPTDIMQALPDARQQSFEEIYGPPENFLEIEVLSFPDHTDHLDWHADGDIAGPQPTDAWRRAAHVYNLRDRLPYEHTCVQAEILECTTTLFRLRIFP